MSDLRKAAEAVLEAWGWDISEPRRKMFRERMEALRQALAQTEQEPVKYTGNGTAGREADVRPTGFLFQMPKREWQGLTRDEVLDIEETTQHPLAFYRAIEAKLKEKNT
jgi:hypothetical protein